VLLAQFYWGRRLYIVLLQTHTMMLKGILFLVVFFPLIASAQENADDSGMTEPIGILTGEIAAKRATVYNIKPAIDIPVTVALGAPSIYLLTIIFSKTPTPESEILKLDKNNVPAIDRWSAGWHDDKLDKLSYYPFYAVMPLPFLLLADRQIARDKGAVGLLYLEAFAFEGIIYSGSVYLVDRFRPDVYNTDLSLQYRTNGNFRNSFFAGHVAVVTLSTLFIARVYDDYHPSSRLKWVFYGGAAAATLGMAYMRLEAGKHFTTDILMGMAVGAACGLGVPVVHKNRNYKNQRWLISPAFYEKGVGFSVNYRL
jgi:membrane-associated phospholipid phosphatase